MGGVGGGGAGDGEDLVAEFADFAADDRGVLGDGDAAGVGWTAEVGDVAGGGVGGVGAGCLSGEEGGEVGGVEGVLGGGEDGEEGYGEE